ncbi:DUF167 domain-containing protein, partial [Paracoccus sanguinis]
MARDLPDLSHLAVSGARIAVRVTPRAGRDAVALDEGGRVQVRTTAPPADGKANDAVRRLLAGALGVAPTRLVLAGGAVVRT